MTKASSQKKTTKKTVKKEIKEPIDTPPQEDNTTEPCKYIKEHKIQAINIRTKEELAAAAKFFDDPRKWLNFLRDLCGDAIEEITLRG